MNNTNLNEMAALVHAANIKWWQNAETGEPIKRNKGELIALMHSELSEALEGEQKSEDEPCPHCNFQATHYRGLELDAGHVWICGKCYKEHIGHKPNWLMDDKLPHRKMAEVELVDCIICILDYAGAFGYDLDGAFKEKMAYNAMREDHTHEARNIAGGKQF